MIVNIRKIYIYQLIDPKNNEVRYIGKTVQDPKYRLYSHISVSKTGRKKDHTHSWIKSLLKINKMPIIKVIEETFDINREIYWINYYTRNGFNLTNHTVGGEQGTLGATWKVSKDKLEKYKYKNNKPILQYNTNGTFIRKWESGADFARYYKLGLSSVSSSIGQNVLCKGYILIKEGDSLDITKYNICKKPVKITNTITKEFYIFESACEAAKNLKIDNSSISKAAKKGNIIYKQFKIEYYDILPSKIS